MSSATVEICDLSAVSSAQIRSLLQDSAFKPNRYLQNRLQGDLLEAWLMSVTALSQSASSHGMVAMRDQMPCGLLVYSENPWETQVIGTKAGAVNQFIVAPNAAPQVAACLLNTALEQASSAGFGLLLARAHSDDYTTIHALESAGFLLMDTVVDCFFDFQRSPMGNAPAVGPDVTLRHATLDDRSELIAVARGAFQAHFGRFHADKRLGKQVAINVYEQWLNSSIDGYADWINIAEISGDIAGFSVWKKPDPREMERNIRIGHYSISGIDPAYHGRGLFTALSYAGMLEMKSFADVVEGPTHINNYGVHAGYSKLGWRVGADARHSFHKWLK
jgi:hypothetical protein